ncbi:hypothetical protein Tdes44962_MAKER01411 [Teratosphaeria destructans]|uniref:Uncharacterized protein n=1 Tax=Teratosphaeria destructans TaxID=418781 RepID=A0A9W7W6A7_9PEZI|nr:hypothetical protein Tdes44962_MAKER01411 [Teratosphaeria destructans]
MPRFQSQPKPNGDSEAEAGVILDKIVDSIPTDRAEASIFQAHGPVSSTASTFTDQDSQARNAVEGSASSLHVDGDLLAGASASNRRVECPSEKFEDSTDTITARVPNVNRQTPPSLPLNGAANRPVAQIFPSMQGREHGEDDDKRDLPTNDNKITSEPSKQASACSVVTQAAETAVAEDARIARLEAQLGSTTSQVTDIQSALATLTQTLHQRLDGPSLRQLGKCPDVSDSLPSKGQMAAAETSQMVMGDHHRDLAAGLMQHAAQSIINAGKMLEIGALLLQGRLSSTSEDAK